MSTESGYFPSGQPEATPLQDTDTVRTVVVTPSGGDYSNIGDAIKDVPAKTRILVRPGTYIESVVLDKDVEIVGDGPRELITLMSDDADCVYVATDAATIRGMTLHGRAENHPAIEVPHGHLQISDCIVTAEDSSCIYIHSSSAQPRIDHCVICNGGQNGILIYDQGAGVIEDCAIFGNTFAGIYVRERGNPQVRRCKVYDGQDGGILVGEEGEGLFEGCAIYRNKAAGVCIRAGGNPQVRRCKIFDGHDSGILVYSDGKGVFEECEVYGNTYSGIEVTDEGRPHVHRCKIHDGNDSGICVYNEGEGIFEDCETSGNKNSGLYVDSGGHPQLQRCTFRDGEKRES